MDEQWEAGFALNKKIAEIVLQWSPVQEAMGDETSWILYDSKGNRVGQTYHSIADHCWDDLPEFGDDLRATHYVLDALRAEYLAVLRSVAEITLASDGQWYVWLAYGRLQGNAPDLPLAICRAVLGMSDGINDYAPPADREEWLKRING